MSRTRLRSALALALFAVVGIGEPIADAVLYHAGAEHGSRPHIESADGPACHAERCTLGSPITPTPPATALVALPPFEAHETRASGAPRADVPLDRSPPHAPGSRAPPA